MPAEALQIEVSAQIGKVSALLERPADARGLYVLAHGAGAGMRHAFLESIAAALARRGVATLRYQLPYMEAGKGRPDAPPVSEATIVAAVATARRLAPQLPLFAGGKSMGGRLTSIAAARQRLGDVRGLVFLGFPLHPPRKPAITRAHHLPEVPVPMLFLQGTRDDLAALDLLRPITDALDARATLAVIEGADHSFHVLKRSGRTDADVLEELATLTSTWMARLDGSTRLP